MLLEERSDERGLLIGDSDLRLGFEEHSVDFVWSFCVVLALALSFVDPFQAGELFFSKESFVPSSLWKMNFFLGLLEANVWEGKGAAVWDDLVGRLIGDGGGGESERYGMSSISSSTSLLFFLEGFWMRWVFSLRLFEFVLFWSTDVEDDEDEDDGLRFLRGFREDSSPSSSSESMMMTSSPPLDLLWGILEDIWKWNASPVNLKIDSREIFLNCSKKKFRRVFFIGFHSLLLFSFPHLLVEYY